MILFSVMRMSMVRLLVRSGRLFVFVVLRFLRLFRLKIPMRLRLSARLMLILALLS